MSKLISKIVDFPDLSDQVSIMLSHLKEMMANMAIVKPKLKKQEFLSSTSINNLGANCDKNANRSNNIRK